MRAPYRRPARVSLRPGARHRRGRAAAAVARPRRPDAPPLARAGRGRVLRDLLLRVGHALLSGPRRVGPRRPDADAARAGALRALARPGARAAPAAADRHRRRPRAAPDARPHRAHSPRSASDSSATALPSSRCRIRPGRAAGRTCPRTASGSTARSTLVRTELAGSHRLAPMDVVETAQRLADEVLFPAALATDAAETRCPVELLDALAEAGLYGLAGPRVGRRARRRLPDRLPRSWRRSPPAASRRHSSGCQHIGATLAAAGSENEAVRERVAGSLCRGERRAGLALGGALPGPPRLVARETDGRLDASTAARRSSPAGDGSTSCTRPHARTTAASSGRSSTRRRGAHARRCERLRLVALNATATVQSDVPRAPGSGRARHLGLAVRRRRDAAGGLRLHASLALGVADRCCTLLGSSPLDDELTACRAELDRLDPETIGAARAAAGELALRSSAALLTVHAAAARFSSTTTRSGSRAKRSSFSSTHSDPASRDALLGRLGAA